MNVFARLVTKVSIAKRKINVTLHLVKTEEHAPKQRKDTSARVRKDTKEKFAKKLTNAALVLAKMAELVQNEMVNLNVLAQSDSKA